MGLQAINSDNRLIDHVTYNASLWWEIKEEVKSLSKMMMWQKKYALKLLNFMEN